MIDIVAFLTARLDEDEATARGAGPARIAWLTYRRDNGEMNYTTVASAHFDDCWVAGGRELAAPASARVVYDPARVLRDVAAKRDRLELLWAARENWRHGAGTMGTTEEIARATERRDVLEMVIRLDAEAYADHPDYQEGWKP